MNPNYLGFVNHIQFITPQNKKDLYNIYKEFIPKGKQWSKYLKPSTKKPNEELIKYIRTYFECSSKEAIEYFRLLEANNTLDLLKSMGVEEKEIKKIIK